MHFLPFVVIFNDFLDDHIGASSQGQPLGGAQVVLAELRVIVQTHIELMRRIILYFLKGTRAGLILRNS